MTAPARRAAYDVLRANELNREDLATILDRTQQSLKDQRDCRLAFEIILGVLRWRSALDHIIGQLSSRPFGAIDAAVLNILRTAIYQLLNLDRVPRHAVVTDAVSLTREIGVSSASGFVNAILRSLTEGRVNISLPEPPEDAYASYSCRTKALEYLSITLSHPRWLVERWLERYGWSATSAWARFNNQPARTIVRSTGHGLTRSSLRTALAHYNVLTEPTRLSPHGLVVTKGNPTKTPLAADGKFSIQEEASQLIANLIEPSQQGLLLDLCAAPGGKTVSLTADHPDAFVVASDLRARRLSLLKQAITRLKLERVAVVQLDATARLPFQRIFRGVLVDAPCSGLGVIRRDPDIRWKRTEQDLLELVVTQRKILRNAAAVVRPGGWLIYATCSSEPEENEEVVQHFLECHPDFVVRPPLSASLSSMIDENGFFSTLPYRDGVDAFFGAALQRKIF